MDTVELSGRFANGSGRAGKWFETKKRQAFMRSVFGRDVFHGTFNFVVSGSKVRAPQMITRELAASREADESDSMKWKFYLCDLIKGSESVPVILMFWWRNDHMSGKCYLELISRERIPDDFKSGELTLIVYGRWSEDRAREWASTQHWFQTFPWSPPKADSAFVWGKIKDLVSWQGKSVLDIGGHSGYYSFKAANNGAHVVLFEPTTSSLNRAKTIGHHIECTDVRYTSKDPQDNYDTILYMSVHHLPDPTFEHLEEKLQELRSRCQDLLLELIVPPLKGDMTAERVDEIVGVAPLVNYKHKVRCFRRIYHVKGDL